MFEGKNKKIIIDVAPRERKNYKRLNKIFKKSEVIKYLLLV